MNGNRNADWLARAIILAMFALSIWAWPSAPGQAPVHWNIVGQMNGYWSKLLALYLMPLNALAGYAFMGVVADRWREKFEGRVRGALSLFKLMYVLLMAGAFGVIVADASIANLIMIYAIVPLFLLNAIAVGNLMVRSIQLERQRAARPGDGIPI